MKQILSGFGLITGASYPFRVLRVFSQNSYLWQYLLIPIVLNFILGITLYSAALFLGWQRLETWLTNLSNWLDNLLINLPTWLGILDYFLIAIIFLVHLLLILGLLIVTGFLLGQFGVLLGSFWYGQLSEQLEKIKTGKIVTIEVGIFRDIMRAILFEVKKLFLILVVGFFALLLNFLPVIGTLLTTICGVILTATLICLDFLDSPLERRRFSFRNKLSIIITSLPASAGFSLVCLGLISIPLLNLLTIPFCVASGTLFFCDRILPKLSESQENRDKNIDS